MRQAGNCRLREKRGMQDGKERSRNQVKLIVGPFFQLWEDMDQERPEAGDRQNEGKKSLVAFYNTSYNVGERSVPSFA